MKKFLYLIVITVILMTVAAQGALAADKAGSEEGPLTLLQEPAHQPQSKGVQTPQLPQMQQDQGEALQLYDIYGVVPTQAPVPYLYIILGVLLLIACCALGYYFMRKRAVKPLPAILPWEQALSDLADARSVQNLAQGRLYMDRVSQILRRYIEQRFAIKTTRKTTSEFLHSLQKQRDGELNNYRGELQSCLEQADMAKFAHKVQDESNLIGIEEAVTLFVQSTRLTAGQKEGQK